jgi:hypothetical protein
MDLSRTVDLSGLLDGLSVTPSVSGAVGTSDLDTTWSVTPTLGLGWEIDDLTIQVNGNSTVRSWDANDYAASGSIGYQLSSTTSISASAGTALYSGEWARGSFGWSRRNGDWETGSSIGVGYLWDVEVTSQGGKGNRTDNIRTTNADQWQLTPTVQISRRLNSIEVSMHLDGDLRTYERVKSSSGGKGKKAASKASTTDAMWTYSITADPWAGIAWNRDALGINLSSGWSQSYGTGASDGGAWASLSSSVSW